MKWETFKEKVQLEASVPKMNDKWFRLSKFAEEYGEYSTAVIEDKKEEELHDSFFTLALLVKFAKIVDQKEDIINCLTNFECVVWGLQIHNKEDAYEFNLFVTYMRDNLLNTEDLGQVLDTAYERLAAKGLLNG